MHKAPNTADFTAPAKAGPPRRRSAGKIALRWLAGVSVLALLGATGFSVAHAFADMAREDALAGAYQEATRDAARAAGGNPGSDWPQLLETPAGRRSLALWFETLSERWPAACAERLAQVSQSSVACLPDSGLLHALVETRLGEGGFERLAANVAATAEERAAPLALERPLPPASAAVTLEPPTRRAADLLRQAPETVDEEEMDWRAFEPAPAATPAMDFAPLEGAPSLNAFEEAAPAPTLEVPAPEADATPAAGPTLDPEEAVAADPPSAFSVTALDGPTLAMVTP